MDLKALAAGVDNGSSYLAALPVPVIERHVQIFNKNPQSLFVIVGFVQKICMRFAL
jgi:hypothetical protein